MHEHTVRYGVPVSGVRNMAPCGPAADEHSVIGHRKDGTPIRAIAGGSIDAPPRADLLTLIERMDAGDASIDRLFESDLGRRVGGRNDERYMRSLAAFTELLVDARAGSHRAIYRLKETQTTSDFPLLFGDVLQRQLLGSYREFVPSYRQFVRIGDVPDFRSVKRFFVDGAEGVLTKVGEAAPYPQGVLSEGSYSYAVEKYGRRLDFTWEDFINDDLGALPNSPQRLAKAARRSEARFVTTLYVDANGPHASFYTVGNKNLVTTANGAASNNPALTIGALQDAMTVLANQLDADSEPIAIDALVLVVPPALEIVAQNILNALQIEVTIATAGGVPDAVSTGGQRLVAQNWMKGRVTLVVDAYIPRVASTANGARSWFLFASPSEGRPALEVGFLRGNQEPALFRKVANAERIGGGTSPFEGDFDHDTLAMKVRHVFGGARMDPKMTIASNGSGS